MSVDAMVSRPPGATVGGGRADQWTWTDGVDGSGELDRFAGPAGVVSAAQLFRTDGWLHPGLRVWMTGSGDVAAARGLRQLGTEQTISTGREWEDDARSRLVALCEGFERHCSLLYDSSEFVVASADDLGPRAMTFEGMARFSAAEIRRSGGALQAPSRAATIRWYDGVDLHSASPAWLPATMTFITAELLVPERFWLPFSTGVAVHRTAELALVRAICEIAERDAAALCWLQKIPMPLVDPAVLSPVTRQLVDWFADRDVRTLFFDATTELGIPTVWCLQLSDDVADLAQTCATATALDHATAAHKAAVECTSGREILHALPSPPASYSRYTGVTPGAIHLAGRSRRAAFDFLLADLGDRPIAEPRAVAGSTPADQLGHLLEILDEHDQPAFAADLSTREATEAGLVAARVVLPRMMPMSVKPRAAYRGTPRLYQAPAAMGHPIRPESRLNPYPIPLA